MSLFSRLLWAQSSEVRSNLENFLTETLCDLLNRISIEEQRQLLRAIGIEPLDDEALSFTTQVSIKYKDSIKFVDLVGFSKGQPIIVIENKVGAPFTKHVEADEGQDRKEVTSKEQLQVYGEWLSKRNLNGILVLLTAFTAPPSGFEEPGTNGYGTLRRRTVSWQQVHDAVGKMTSYALAEDFREFLRRQNIAMENPSRTDFAIVELFLKGPGDRISRMLKDSREGLRKQFGEGAVNWGAERIAIASGFQAVYSESLIWSYVVRNRKPYAYIAWGIMFPDPSQTVEWNWNTLFQTGAPKQPFIFMGPVTTERADGELIKKRLPPAVWKLDAGDWDNEEFFAAVATMPLTELLEEADVRVSFQEWVVKRFGETLEAVE